MKRGTSWLLVAAGLTMAIGLLPVGAHAQNAICSAIGHVVVGFASAGSSAQAFFYLDGPYTGTIGSPSQHLDVVSTDDPEIIAALGRVAMTGGRVTVLTILPGAYDCFVKGDIRYMGKAWWIEIGHSWEYSLETAKMCKQPFCPEGPPWK